MTSKACAPQPAAWAVKKALPQWQPKPMRVPRKSVATIPLLHLELISKRIEVDQTKVAAQTCCYVLLELAQRHAANAVKRQGKETGGVPRAGG